MDEAHQSYIWPLEDAVQTEVVFAGLRRGHGLLVEWVQADGAFLRVLVWAQTRCIHSSTPYSSFQHLPRVLIWRYTHTQQQCFPSHACLRMVWSVLQYASFRANANTPLLTINVPHDWLSVGKHFYKTDIILYHVVRYAF